MYYVIPCYNEEAVLPETAKRLEEKMNDLIRRDVIRQDSRVVFVNDGSKDSTWDVIVRLHEGNPLFPGINLSRNRGHQNALLAGMMTVAEYADMIISMDADLQDDIHACDEMIAKYYEGCDIVYGVRSSRKKDTFFKRFTAQSFYRTMDRLGAKTVYNHADYRLMSRRAVQALGEFREVNLVLRGMVPLLGFRTDTVYYERGERFAGESKYPLKKMVSFAVEGITSLSTTPLRMISWSGFFIFLVSLIILVYSLVRHFTGHTVVGWTFLAVSIWGIGGLILLSLGIIGEYVGKIYLETKQRPRYIVEEYLDDAHGYRL
ncbi:MAG: glycosyltransferase family 2 protein [Solobacterium sp.]|nr:glycosyltransferase family 2 protein [Solobacterium sp.]